MQREAHREIKKNLSRPRPSTNSSYTWLFRFPAKLQSNGPAAGKDFPEEETVKQVSNLLYKLHT